MYKTGVKVPHFIEDEVNPDGFNGLIDSDLLMKQVIPDYDPIKARKDYKRTHKNNSKVCVLCESVLGWCVSVKGKSICMDCWKNMYDLYKERIG